MTTPLVIEEESGTSRGLYHPHNGYYAGDFSRTPQTRTPFRPDTHVTPRYYALNTYRAH